MTLDDLERLERARTRDYPWFYDELGDAIHSVLPNNCYANKICDIRGYGDGLPMDANGRFIAALANSAGALIAVAKAARAAIAEADLLGVDSTILSKVRAALKKLEGGA